MKSQEGHQKLHDLREWSVGIQNPVLKTRLCRKLVVGMALSRGRFRYHPVNEEGTIRALDWIVYSIYILNSISKIRRIQAHNTPSPQSMIQKRGMIYTAISKETVPLPKSTTFERNGRHKAG